MHRREQNIIIRDAMTGAYTPYGESFIVSPEELTGRICIDWKNMHADYERFGGRLLEQELTKIAQFLTQIFRKYDQTVVTYISGDTFVVSSAILTDSQLLNILRANQENLKSLGHLVTVAGFPDSLTAAVFNYWQQHPEHRFNRVEISNQAVCTVDIRHLRAITEQQTLEVIEPLLTNFLGQLQATFFDCATVFRTRCDEYWIFSAQKTPAQLAQKMEEFVANYPGLLEFDWGVGKNLDGADQDLTHNKSQLEPGKRVTDPGIDLYTFHKP